MFIDQHHSGYYESNEIDLDNILVIGKIVYVKNKREDYFGIELKFSMTPRLVYELNQQQKIQNGKRKNIL